MADRTEASASPAPPSAEGGPGGPAPRPRRRRRWLRLVGLTVAFVLGAGAAAGGWWWFRGPGPACGALSRDEIGRVVGERPGRTAFTLSALPAASTPSTTGPAPRHLCVRRLGGLSPGLVQEVTVGLTPRGERAETERPGIALIGAPALEIPGAKGWRWEVAAMQEVDLLTDRGDRVFVRVTKQSGLQPDTAVRLAELAVRRLDHD